MEKIIIINKPKGKTSFQIVREFKKKYPGEKVGHAGTLDPLAEGILIILIGKATKKQSEFMGLKKEYLVEAIFGGTTSTWDLETELIDYPVKNLDKRLIDLTEVKVKKALKKFEGEIEQIVPAFSAVKREGRRLYKTARKKEIPISKLPRRKAIVYKIELIDFKPGKKPRAKIKMLVGKGTYVRSIVYQLGELLGVGATTSKLVRTKIGKFGLNTTVSS